VPLQYILIYMFSYTLLVFFLRHFTIKGRCLIFQRYFFEMLFLQYKVIQFFVSSRNRRRFSELQMMDSFAFVILKRDFFFFTREFMPIKVSVGLCWGFLHKDIFCNLLGLRSSVHICVT